MSRRNRQLTFMPLVCKRCSVVVFVADDYPKHEYLNTLTLGRVRYQLCPTCAARVFAHKIASGR